MRKREETQDGLESWQLRPETLREEMSGTSADTVLRFSREVRGKGNRKKLIEVCTEETAVTSERAITPGLKPVRQGCS